MFDDFISCDDCIFRGDETICPLATNGFQSERDIFASVFDFQKEVSEE